MDSSQAEPGKGSILIVDDDLAARQTLSSLMEAEGYVVRCAPSGQAALMSAREEPPDLVLLDVRLPDGDGFQVCRGLNDDPKTRGVPVIFLGTLEDAQDKVKGFAAGAADYIAKPFAIEEALGRVRTHVALYRLQSDLRRHVEEQTAALRVANVQLAQNVERLHRSEDLLQERLQFETLLSDLSAKFVSVAADELDQEIEDAQRRVCECLDLDLSSLWQGVAASPHLLTLTHFYRRIEGPPPPARMDARDHFPWCQQQVMVGKVFAVSSVENVPPEASRDQESWRHFGIKTSLGFPLSAGGGPIFGVVSFNDMKKEERTWSDELVKRLGLVTQIFANALARKRAEEALRESEARLALAAASADARLWEVDTGTGRSWTTEQGREFYGLAPGEQLTLTRIFDRIHSEDRDRVRRAIEEALQSDRTVRIEYRVIHPDGNIRWIASRGRASVLSGGRPGCVMGVSLDVTDRKRAEDVLRESEARFRNMADTAPVLVWMSGPDKLCTYFNRQWLDFTGRNLAEELGNGWVEGVHQEDRERCLQVYTASFDARQAFDMEYRLRRADGQYRWLADRGVPRISPAGEFLGYIGSCTDITERKEMEGQLQARLRENEDLKRQLERENIVLREEVKQLFAREELVGQSDAMRRVLAQVEQVAATNSTVLIVGETGTGKEMIARAIHHLSRRKDRALITVNCAALPPSLIESELFGREKGAYTGAMTMMKGRFEIADGSTLFLDEIGDLPLEAQAKLLRVVEEGRLERLGSTKSMRVDVRIIAATNRDLTQDAQADTFRKDLYYRLNVFPIGIPPLRERPEDIPLLVWSFVREFERKMGKRIESVPARSLEGLQRYAWPGNVRELRNVIEHAMIVSSGKTLELRVPAIVSGESVASQALEDIERKHILSVLEKSRWRLTGPGGAAEHLGLKRTTLQSRMKKLGIKRPS
jgi:formate hydrogenlyase transcriptional activator